MIKVTCFSLVTSQFWRRSTLSLKRCQKVAFLKKAFYRLPIYYVTNLSKTWDRNIFFVKKVLEKFQYCVTFSKSGENAVRLKHLCCNKTISRLYKNGQIYNTKVLKGEYTFLHWYGTLIKLKSLNKLHLTIQSLWLL